MVWESILIIDTRGELHNKGLVEKIVA
eukprot:SAG11_NODE_29811_length_307_cov_0.572115_1_plen_26_part_10